VLSFKDHQITDQCLEK